ncbi:efflux RND transporter periplasmic adaptor subunit [Emticicia fluvialis]|uniref:efflux RND transporter periplasmic adaptor subunit n=1 Tax=Emticicia fluvialis TaxID=2974474 RepID=UPI0021661AEC|nr:efflux RND transporter periplasmic adaptor subunit [Emticicia fluvialis]
MKTYFFLSLIGLACLQACTKNTDANKKANTSTADSAQTNAPTGLIRVSAEQFKNLHLGMGNFKEMPLNEEIKANGVADVPPENMASISLPINGFVKNISSNNALPGRFVTKGTVLATIESIEFIQMQQDYFQAAAHTGFLEKELERQQSLNAEDIGVKKKLQQAESDFKGNQALVKSLEAKLRVLGTNIAALKKGDISATLNIIAPISGYIKATNINTGKSVAPNDVLFEIISKEHLHVELKILEKDAFKIQKGQKVLIDDTRLGDKVEGTVFLVGQTFETDSKAINVHVHLNNEQQEQRLIPGMFINARVLTGTRNARTLPESAVLREPDGNFIMILEKQNDKEAVFRKIPVKLGGLQEGNIEILPVGNLDFSHQVVISNGHFLSGMSGTDEE